MYVMQNACLSVPHDNEDSSVENFQKNLMTGE